MELKANELRLNNLFIEENTKKIIKVIALKENRIVFSGMFLEKWQAKPIQLTEEWLLKFGFNKSESERWCDMHEEFEECVYYYYDMFKLYYNPEIGCYTDDTFEFVLKLECVHQLQNLYFALTNEELEIKM